MSYKTTIGLEIHAELKTKTKMFCNSKNDTEEKNPNVNICPICMGHPGTLPAINKEAVKKTLKVGVALGADIADFSEFDRKNYFYPDIPKGYQISQYKHPLVKGGELNGVKIIRVHLEEDTAKSSHDIGDYSLLDFNRAGIPLMELVTEPVIHSASEAAEFAKELQLLLRYLGATDANMEKGEMRVEANISVSQISNLKSKKLGTKVEVKNLNSFRAVERAIAYETERQIVLIESGEKVIQETRGWDEDKQKTFSQRLKEESRDYRYFPDPDLPKLKIREIPEFNEANLRKELPELPRQKRGRLKKDFSLKDEAVEIFIQDSVLGNFFEAVIIHLEASLPSQGQTSRLGSEASKLKDGIQMASNYIISDLLGMMKEKSISADKIKISPEMFARLINMATKGELYSRATKDVLKIMFEKGGDPEKIVEERGLKQIGDDSFIKNIAEQVIKENPAVAEDYKNGKEVALQFLIGQGMKLSCGKANPEELKKYLTKLLGG